MVWSVIQVNILMLRPTFVPTKAKTTGVQQLDTPRDGNVLTIAGLLRQRKLAKPGFKGMCLMLSHHSAPHPEGRAPTVHQIV